MSEKTHITPATLAALAKGDTFNAALSMTPGGIEAQEAAGQKVFVQAQTLPTRGLMEHAEALRKLGFVIGEPVSGDPIFTNVTLPAGWKKAPTGHSMWSDLVDDKGRRRAGLFYKAAFYDRKAHIQWDSAIGSKVTAVDGRSVYDLQEREAVDMVGVVELCGREVYRTPARHIEPTPTRHALWDAEVALRIEVEAWVAANYPEVRDPFAYWETR